MEIKTKFNLNETVTTPDGIGVIKSILLVNDKDNEDIIIHYDVSIKQENTVIASLYYKESELSKSILTEKEKQYLKSVIEPFRDKVLRIRKRKYYISSFEYIYIVVKSIEKNKTEGFALPCFEERTMYKGMEIDRYYTLEELGL